MEENKSNHGMPVSSLVLGIISIIFASCWYIALPTGILAIVFGAKSTKKLGSKLAKAGLITGIIGISLSVFLYISMILIWSLSVYC